MRRAFLLCAASVSMLALGGEGFVRFVDWGSRTGITLPNTFGGKEHKEYILESTGTGVAIFDYDGDGAEDVFIANGSTMDLNAPPSPSQLYHNDGKGHF